MITIFYRINLPHNDRVLSTCVTLSFLLIPLMFVIICYLKSVYLLKLHSDIILSAIQLKVKDVYIYTFVQIFTYIPTIVFFVLRLTYYNTDFGAWGTLPGFFLGLSGFANCFVYFFKRLNSIESDQQTKLEKLETYISFRRDTADKMLIREAIGGISLETSMKIRDSLNSSCSISQL